MGGAVVHGQRRTIPMALLYIGIPAYVVVVGFSVADVVRSHSLTVATAAIAAIGVFSAGFLWLALASAAARTSGRVLFALAVMAVLATALAFLGATTAIYLITVAAMAGDQLAPRLAIPVIVLATVGVALYSVSNESDLESVLSHTVVPVVVGLFAFGVARLTVANDELVAAREEVARLAVGNERLRFARDMHDLLGHSLTVIRAKSELASRLAADDPERAGREMDDVERLARQALADVREAVTGYRQSSLAAEIANGRTALRSAGIEADVDVDAVAVQAEIDETLGWVVREALTNVVRHSGASRCRVATSCAKDEVRLEVADDGGGTDVRGDGGGTGLIGIRERLAAVGGTLEVGPSAGGGFRVVARVPTAT